MKTLLLLIAATALQAAAPQGTPLDELRGALGRWESAGEGPAKSALAARCDALVSTILDQVDAELQSPRTPVADATVDAIATRRLPVIGPVQRLARQLRAKLQFAARADGERASGRLADQARRLAAVLEAGPAARASQTSAPDASRAGTLRVRAMLAIGSEPVVDDTVLLPMFTDFVKKRHANGPAEVWYRFVPAHPDRFLLQNDHVASRPIIVDIPQPAPTR